MELCPSAPWATLTHFISLLFPPRPPAPASLTNSIRPVNYLAPRSIQNSDDVFPVYRRFFEKKKKKKVVCLCCCCVKPSSACLLPPIEFQPSPISSNFLPFSLFLFFFTLSSAVYLPPLHSIRLFSYLVNPNFQCMLG